MRIVQIETRLEPLNSERRCRPLIHKPPSVQDPTLGIPTIPKRGAGVYQSVVYIESTFACLGGYGKNCAVAFLMSLNSPGW